MTYLVRFHNGYRMQETLIEAKNYWEAREAGFRWMCKRCGDRINTLEIYEMKTPIPCHMERNPVGCFGDWSERDERGRQVNPEGKKRK